MLIYALKRAISRKLNISCDLKIKSTRRKIIFIFIEDEQNFLIDHSLLTHFKEYNINHSIRLYLSPSRQCKFQLCICQSSYISSIDYFQVIYNEL